MKGLLKKEWYAFLQKPVTFLFPLALFVVLAIQTKSQVILMYLPLYFGILPVTLMSADEVSHWERYMHGLPYSRSAIVSEKYVTVLILSVFSMLVSGVLLFFFMNTGFAVSQFLFLIAAAFAASVLLPSVMLPLNLRFGAAKARIALGVIFAVFGCLAALSVDDDGGSRFQLLEKLAGLNISLGALTGILFASAAVIMAASWCIALMLYRKKQF